MKITHSDKTTEQVDLNQKDFRYTQMTEKSIAAVDLYDNEVKLVSATYDSYTKEWIMDLSSVSAGDMYNGGWKYKTYKLMEADNSAFVSADIDTDAVQKKYCVGEKLNLDGLIARVTTEKGNRKRFDSWNELENNGFKIDLASDYKFTTEDIGTKTITISIVLKEKTVTKSFEVEVAKVEKGDQTPAKVVFSENGTKLAEVPISEDDLKKGKGYVTKSNVKLPETYRGHLNQLEVTVYNADDIVLEHNLGNIKAFYIQILLPEYKVYQESGGSLTVSFEFVSTGAKATAEEAKQEDQVKDQNSDSAGKEIVNASEDPSDEEKVQKSEDSAGDSAEQEEDVQEETDTDTSVSADEPEITEAEEKNE